jgi:hypothetical protein
VKRWVRSAFRGRCSINPARPFLPADSNSAIQPYDPAVTQLMDQAALEEGGFGSDKQQADAQVISWGPLMDVEPLSQKLWEGRPQIYAATYCCECNQTWERSGVIGILS